MSGTVQQLFTRVLHSYRSSSSPAADDRIPEAFSAFLNCLARPQERLLPVARQLGCDAGELQDAAYAYLHRLLFRKESDHYRTLGLAPDASAAEIRDRYRLLISLFHPDRIATGARWEEQFVRRLNQAYGVLKRPEKRRRYDRELGREYSDGRDEPPAQQAARSQAPSNRSRRTAMPEVAATELFYRYRFLARHPKATIWLLILVALVILLLVSTNGSKVTTLTLTEAPPSEGRVADRVPGSLFSSRDDRLSVSGRLPVPPAASESAAEKALAVKPLMERRSPVPAEKPTVFATGSGRFPPTSVSERNISRIKKRRTESDKSDLTEASSPRSGEVRGRAVEQAMVTARPSGFDDAPVPASLQLPIESGAEAVQAMPGEATAPQMQPEYVLMQYVHAFEDGDLERLLSLFILEPRSNAGVGRAKLRESYSRVFARTRNRTFAVEQVTIRPLSADTFEMISRMRLFTETKEGDQILYRGDMAFQLIRKGRKLYIASLLHNVTRQPLEQSER